MAQKITYWLLTTLILSLGFGQLLRFEFYGVPVYLHDLLVVMLLLLQSSSLQSRTLKVPFALRIFFLGLTIGWVRALTLSPLPDLIIPSLYSLRLLAYLTLYLSLRTSKIQIPLNVFLFSGLVSCLVGYLQYFLLPDMRLFQYLGWDDHLNRLTLPHFDPTFTGVMLGMTILLIPLSRWYLSLLVAAAILLTYSRSVWLSLFATFTLYVKNKTVLLIALLATIILIIALPQAPGEGTNLLRTFSIESRYTHDFGIAKGLNWNLVTGVGMNTFKTSINHSAGPNNSYLYLLATTGILGLLGWGLFMKELYLKSRYKPVLIFLLFASLFNNVMFYPFALLYLLLLESVKVPSES